MSIEKTLERIASALEKISDSMSTPAPVAPAAPVAPVAPAAPAAPAAAPVAAPVAQLLTAVEMNQTLINEFKRLGSREGIDAVMQDAGVSSVNDLTDAPAQQSLILAIQALKA